MATVAIMATTRRHADRSTQQSQILPVEDHPCTKQTNHQFERVVHNYITDTLKLVWWCKQ